MTCPTSTRFENDAEEWLRQGRPAEISKSQWYTMQLICWSGSSGGKAVGVSKLLTDYQAALQKQFNRDNPNWYEDLWDDRVHCSTCGQSWRVENVHICSICSATFPPCHVGETTMLPHGNPECPTCGEGEIVG
jgi:hypothetical protein